MENLAQYINTLNLIDRAVYFRDVVMEIFVEGEQSEILIPDDYIKNLDEEIVNSFTASMGLCYNLDLESYLSESEMNDIFKKWAYFSGDLLFPVPDPDFIGDVVMARKVYCKHENLYSGIYGEYRVHLLNHIINSLHSSLKDLENS